MASGQPRAVDDAGCARLRHVSRLPLWRRGRERPPPPPRPAPTRPTRRPASLCGASQHYTQFQKSEDLFGCQGVDLYESHAPALGLNGTYGTFTYTRRAVELVEAHNTSVPLFLYMALQVMHAPQEVPARFSDQYSGTGKYSDDYAIMNGMATAADESLGNVSAALKGRGMWRDTLLVYTADNGGPAGQLSSGHSGNNWPLRGGKNNVFEGGVRVAAFVAGGFVPSAARGRSAEGYIHACDWYHTLINP